MPFWVSEDKNFLFLCSSLVRVNSFSKVHEFKLLPFILLFLVSLYFSMLTQNHIHTSLSCAHFYTHWIKYNERTIHCTPPLIKNEKFVLLNLIKNKKLGKQFKEHNCKHILNLKFWIGGKFHIKKMGPFTIKKTSWSKHWIFFKDFIWYVVCLPWLKIPNLIDFIQLFDWISILKPHMTHNIINIWKSWIKCYISIKFITLIWNIGTIHYVL
jgi:hypothetical protein